MDERDNPVLQVYPWSFGGVCTEDVLRLASVYSGGVTLMAARSLSWPLLSCAALERGPRLRGDSGALTEKESIGFYYR